MGVEILAVSRHGEACADEGSGRRGVADSDVRTAPPPDEVADRTDHRWPGESSDGDAVDGADRHDVVADERCGSNLGLPCP
jgi:hypothetical protein